MKTTPLHLLLLENSEGQLADFKETLGGLGYRVTASHLGAAVGLIEEVAPQLIVLLMDGVSSVYTANLRGQAQDKNIPILALLPSATDTLGAGWDEGFDDFVPLSAPPELVRFRIQKVLKLRQQSETLELYRQELADAHLESKNRERLNHLIVHDLGNLLTVTMGLSQLLVNKAVRGPVERKVLLSQLPIIHSAGTDMTVMIRGILDLSRLESGEMQLFPVEVDCNDLIQRVVKRFAVHASQRQIEIKMNLAKEELLATVDEKMTSQVIVNLVVNALRHAGPEATVVCSAKRAVDGGILLTVSDDGPGIAEEETPHVFEKFFQIDSGDAVRKKIGVGLGLAYSKAAMDLLGGRIWLESAHDEGSHFHVWLPAKPG